MKGDVLFFVIFVWLASFLDEWSESWFLMLVTAVGWSTILPLNCWVLQGCPFLIGWRVKCADLLTGGRPRWMEVTLPLFEWVVSVCSRAWWYLKSQTYRCKKIMFSFLITWYARRFALFDISDCCSLPRYKCAPGFMVTYLWMKLRHMQLFAVFIDYAGYFDRPGC